jgi:hypothetical protein
MWRWIHHSKADIISSLYYQWKINIVDLTTEEIELFNSQKELWISREFIERFLHCTKTWEKIINKDWIKNVLNSFQYPICFYDYETISVPLPLFDNSYA